MKGIFVTATDTGAGKTIITAGIVLTLQRQGYKTVGMKPVETGCSEIGGRLIPQDGTFLHRINGSVLSIDEITPLRYRLPLAPSVASEIENKPLEIEKIYRTYERLKSEGYITVVEGIGGLMVPLRKGFFVADLIRELQLPILLVADNRLGVINHTLLSIEAIKNRGLKLIGVVLNQSSAPKGSIAEKTNYNALKGLGIPLLGQMPHIDPLNEENILSATLENLYEGLKERLS